MADFDPAPARRVFDKLHYLKKPWRNLETFDSSLFEMLGEQFVYFATKDKGK